MRLYDDLPALCGNGADPGLCCQNLDFHYVQKILHRLEQQKPTLPLVEPEERMLLLDSAARLVGRTRTVDNSLDSSIIVSLNENSTQKRQHSETNMKIVGTMWVSRCYRSYHGVQLPRMKIWTGRVFLGTVKSAAFSAAMAHCQALLAMSSDSCAR